MSVDIGKELFRGHLWQLSLSNFWLQFLSHLTCKTILTRYPKSLTPWHHSFKFSISSSKSGPDVSKTVQVLFLRCSYLRLASLSPDFLIVGAPSPSEIGKKMTLFLACWSLGTRSTKYSDGICSLYYKGVFAITLRKSVSPLRTKTFRVVKIRSTSGTLRVIRSDFKG